MTMLDPEQVASLLNEELESERAKSAELERSKQALIEEFNKANTHDEVLEAAQKGIKDLLPKAILQMGHLLQYAESESVRASLSKYITDTVITHKIEGEGTSEIKTLLKQLANNPTGPASGS